MRTWIDRAAACLLTILGITAIAACTPLAFLMASGICRKGRDHTLASTD